MSTSTGPGRAPAPGAPLEAGGPGGGSRDEELRELRQRLAEAEDTLRAIRLGEVDAFVIQTPDGPRAYSLTTADHPYRMLVEQASEAALTLTPDGLIVYSNGRLQQLLGLADEEGVGRTLAELVTGDQLPALARLLERARHGSAAGEIAFRGRGSDPIPLHLSLSPLASQSFTGICAIATDLTEQKRRDREAADERLTSAVLEFAGTAILVCDAGGRVLRANRMATAVLGEELGNRTYDALVPDGPRFAEIIGPPLAEERREWSFETAAGITRYVVSSARRIVLEPHDEDSRWVVTLTDVTHRKEVDAERLRMLEAEHSARATAEAANLAKAQFLAVMSHELRTPLSAVIGYADLIGEGVAGPASPAQTLYIGRIKTSAWHLLSLIEGILSFARVEAGKETTTIESTDVGAIAAEVASVVEVQAKAKGLELRVSLPDGMPPAPTDAAKLRQILLNLLGNAVKFTERGHVDLAVEHSGCYALCHVRDSGPGIAPQDLQRIFEPFVQGDQSSTRRAGGTGLGLTIARQFAGMLGGEITVQSQVGVGSTFTLRLPLEGA